MAYALTVQDWVWEFAYANGNVCGWTQRDGSTHLFLLTSMDADLGKVVKKELKKWHNQVESEDNENCDYDRLVFTNCKNIEPREIKIWTNPRNLDWQVGFFDADREVYFDKIIIGEHGTFSSIVRNYWWNGKEEEEKKEGYYSLIQSVRQLETGNERAANDLADYVEGRYEAGEHWQIHELDRNIELRIDSKVEETTVEQLQKYFDNIWCHWITADLKTENNITCNCECYWFRNCREVVPQKLVINVTVEKINFYSGVVNEIHIPEVVMEEKADLKSIIQNTYGQYGYYSLLPYIQTLVIRNNLKMLCDLADYINGRYKINDDWNNWKLHQLNKNMKIMIQKPQMAFGAVKEISNYFADVLVDNNKPQEYLVKQQPYQKSFQEHFDKYDLEAGQIENLIPASYVLRLEDQKFNIGSSNRKISRLHVNQKLAPQYFVCFHDTNKPVAIDNIIIDDSGDLRCVLQNAYYNGTDSGFFSLLRTAKELEIRSDRSEENKVLVNLADYIEGKYSLNTNWRQEELDRDMRINVDSGRHGLSLNLARRLRYHFRNVSVDAIWILLQAENVIDQECENTCVFVNSRETNPQKLIINAKLMGGGTLILFNDADGEVHIPEITIDEQGQFAAIVRNSWQNNKKGSEYKYENYSLIQHVQTLIIRNNPGALDDFADYVVGKYKIRFNYWKLQQLNNDIKIVVEGPGDAFLPVLRIFNHFNEVIVDGKQPEDYLATQELQNDPDYKAFRTCFGVHGLYVEPFQYSVEAKEKLELDCTYNIRKSVDSIDSLTVRQKLDINQFVCFYDIDKAVTIDKILIDDAGDLRSVLQNAYYSNGQGWFFSLLRTAKRLEISNNDQVAEDLANYVDGIYALHPKWGTQALDRNIEIKLHHDKYYDKYAFSLDVTRRLRSYFRNVSIDCIQTPLETKNVINQESGNKYVFTNSRDVSPQKLVVNARLAGRNDLILFNGADGEVCIPEITIGKHGSFSAIVRNYWQNIENGSKRKWGYYSLISHVETLIIQNNQQAVRDLDRYVSGNYKIKNDNWKIQKLDKNIVIRINGVKGLDEQINRLKEYFGYIFINYRKALGTQHHGAMVTIQLGSDKIQQQSTANADKRNAIAQADAEIAETRRRIERARARLGRRRARFQEYLALAE